MEQEDQNTYDLNEYRIYFDQPLGEGSYGKVYKATYIENQAINLAVKELPIKNYQQSDSENFRKQLSRELQIFKTTGECPYLLDFKGILKGKKEDKESYYYIFMQYANSGNLSQQISLGISEQQAMIWFSQMVEGYKILKENNFIHRDLKPDNILLNEEVNGKKIAIIGDFGLGRKLDLNANQNQEFTATGTPYYRAPELLKSGNVIACNKCDIWSMGIILFQLVCGKLPFRGDNITNLLQDIENCYLDINEDVSENIQDLICKMLVKDPSQRISWDDLFQHPAIIKI